MKLIVISLILTWLCACTSIRASSDYEQGLDFSTYKTFAMAAPPRPPLTSFPSYSEISGREINAAVAEHLEAKGLKAADEAVADLIFSFSLVGERREDVRSSGAPTMSMGMGVGGYHGWYGSAWYTPTVYTVAYVQGTLVVDAFDRAREQVVWHGWSTVSLYSDQDRTRKGDAVLDAVMELFPPQ